MDNSDDDSDDDDDDDDDAGRMLGMSTAIQGESVINIELIFPKLTVAFLAFDRSNATKNAERGKALHRHQHNLYLI